MYHTIRLAQLGESERACVYDVRVYARPQGVTVILSEVPANRGRISITNAIEYVATDIMRGLMEKDVVVDPESIEWIEHYPTAAALGYNASGRDTDVETFDTVELTWSRSEMRYKSPAWRPYGNRRTPPVFEESSRVI